MDMAFQTMFFQCASGVTLPITLLTSIRTVGCIFMILESVQGSKVIFACPARMRILSKMYSQLFVRVKLDMAFCTDGAMCGCMMDFEIT
jgi:hypothetical protein